MPISPGRLVGVLGGAAVEGVDRLGDHALAVGPWAVRDPSTVKRSDLAGPGTGGDVGPAVSAHLTDEPRPDLTHDGCPVERIIPEFGKYVRLDLRGANRVD